MDNPPQMNPMAYIETSVVSYLTARPSRDVVGAAYQEVTREWWRDAAARFHLVASELVVSECRAGDRSAAHARLEALDGVALLNASADAKFSRAAYGASLQPASKMPHTRCPPNPFSHAAARD